MKKYLIPIILFISINSFSQNLDSLYNHYMNLHQIDDNIKKDSPQHVHEPIKCGFGAVMQIKANFDRFTPDQQQSLKKVMSRPGKQTSRVSPSGYFRIHYDTTGSEIPMYFTDDNMSQRDLIEMSVDSLAVSLDSSYNYEINILGYPEPSSDGTDGGDDKYDVYLEPYGGYGETRWDGPYNAAYMVIDNKLSNTYVKGIKAAKVTAAHEFHHAIQVGNYSDDISQLFIFEMTATSMEEFVYDDINDYYNYLGDYFKNPAQRLDNTNGNGYDICIWNIFLVEKFEREKNDPFYGQRIIKRVWDIFGSGTKAIKAIEQALIENGYSFNGLFNEFGIWCYFTRIKNDPSKYFIEGEYYPTIKPINTYTFIGEGDQKYIINSNPVSNNYIRIVTRSSDTLMAVITNSDVVSIANESYDRLSFDLTVSPDKKNNSIQVAKGFNISVSSKNNSLLYSNYIFRDQIIEGSVSSEEIAFAFPQPFKYSESDFIFIPRNNSISEETELKIYSASMDLVYSEKSPDKSIKSTVKWNGKNNDGEKLATGVYIYVTKTGDDVKTGKLVIYND